GDGGKTFDCTFTNTYQPSVDLTKTGDTLSKIGDLAHYTIELDNTSSAGGAAGAPSLVCDISDPTIGFSKTVTLAPGGSDTSHPTGFTNDIHASGQWSTDLLHPSFTRAKSCDAQPVPQGGTASFTVTLHNTGDADLVIDPDEGANNTYSVAAGGSTTFPVTKT